MENMPFINHSLVSEIRERFCNVDKCPISGERIFFENAGGALTLRSALETSTKFAAIPDNQGRDNLASHTLNNTIKNAKSDLRILFNAQSGEFFMGESGTELLFRLIRKCSNGLAAWWVNCWNLIRTPRFPKRCKEMV